MKVLLVGEQIPGQLAWLCGRAIGRLGVTLAAVHTSGHPLERYRASPWPALAILANALQKSWVNAQLCRVAVKFMPDLVFVTKGDELRASGLQWLKAHLKAKLANWNPDSPLNPLNTTPDLLDAIPIYDLYYTWGQFLLPELARLGARRPCYLPFAYDPELHRPRDLPEAERPKWGNDLVFVGTWEKEREAALAAADAVEALMKKVGHPMRLRDVGVVEENLPICAFHAIADTAVLFNGRPVNDPNEVLEIYKQAY